MWPSKSVPPIWSSCEMGKLAKAKVAVVSVNRNLMELSQSFSPALRLFSCLFLFSSASLISTDQKKLSRRHEREGSPKCYYCDTDENITVEHFLLSCSKYEEIRSELLCQLQGELEAIGATGFQVSIL